MRTKPSITSVERRRLIALHSYDLLNPEKEDFLDSITSIASTICEIPIALITLIDEKKQWFKSKIGLDIEYTERAISFCHHTIKQFKLFEISDTLDNVQFATNPSVTGKLKIRFYAGVPLTDPAGYNLGTLCVIDYKPRKLNENQKNLLSKLAKIAIDYIVLKKTKKNNVILKTQLDNFLKLSPDLICIANPNGYFNWINSTFVEELGYREAELLALPFISFVHEDDKQSTIDILEKINTEAFKVVFFRNRYRCKNGIYIWLSWNAIPDPSTGMIYATARNVTELIRLEEEVKLKNETEKNFQTENLRQLCNLTSSISDELLNPVNLTIGFAEMSLNLLEGLSDAGSNENKNENLAQLRADQQKIIEHGKKIFNVLQKMNYTIMQAHLVNQNLYPNVNRVNSINLLCSQFEKISYDNFRAINSQFNCEFINNFDKRNPQCKINISEFGSFIMGLFYNAFEAIIDKTAMDPNLKPMVKVETTWKHSHVEIRIADNGLIIPDENMKKIFDPFFSTKKAGNGNGLGLTSSYNIIKNNNGEIALEKSEESETVFKITIPAFLEQ